MASPRLQPIIFEQPLNERMRLFLRFEDLLARFEHSFAHADPWSAHCAVVALIELHTLINRVDIKRDLLKEIDRIVGSLSRLADNPAVDDKELDKIVINLRTAFDLLHSLEGQPDQHLVENDLFASIRQRSTIPGGTCGFDLPAYHHWLYSGAEARNKLLTALITPFREVGEALGVLLGLVRTSMPSRQQQAHSGFFEKTLDPAIPWQMIRVEMAADSRCFPEISAGRHRFTIRFLEGSGTGARPRQCKDDVVFRLTCCAL